MNFEEANFREAQMLLLWWSKGALFALSTMHDVMSILARDKNRKKTEAFVMKCINRRRIFEKEEPS